MVDAEGKLHPDLHLPCTRVVLCRSRTDDSCIQQWHGFGQELVKKVHACTLLMYMCYTVRQLLQYSVLNRLHPLGVYVCMCMYVCVWRCEMSTGRQNGHYFVRGYVCPSDL